MYNNLQQPINTTIMRKLFSLLGIGLFTLTFNAQDLVSIEGEFLADDGAKANGTYKTFYNSGNVKAEYNFLDGQENGATTFFHENGKVKEVGTYDYGTKIGKWKSWSSNGKVIGVVNFNKKGKRDGVWEIWDDNGIKRASMEYKNGSRTGNWKVWNENGELTNEKSY